MSLESFIKHVSVGRTHFLYVVKGKREADHVKARIARALDVSTTAIFGESAELNGSSEPPAAA
jgi:hypothetical protein